MTDEEKLLKSARAGDAEALEALVKQYKAMILKVARGYYLTSGGDTDDLIQEGTIGFIKAVGSFDESKNPSFSSFAYGCIASKVKDAVRSVTRDKHLALNNAISMPELEDMEYAAEENSSSVDPFSIYIDEEAREGFYSKVKAIVSPRQLTVLKLYLEGYSYKEIAERLALTAKSVDNALAAVKDKIRKAENMFRG